MGKTMCGRTCPTIRGTLIGLGFGLSLALLAGVPNSRADALDSFETTATDVVVDPFLIQYSTAGAIGTTGITGPNVISYSSIDDARFTAPSDFGLGEFVTAALPDGTSVSYNDTPFTITLLTPTADPVEVTGVLNGTVTGASQTNVTAQFDPVDSLADWFGDSSANGQGSLSMLNTEISLVPASTNRGRTSVQASASVVSPTPIPEPATITVLGALAVGIVLRRRLLPNLA